MDTIFGIKLLTIQNNMKTKKEHVLSFFRENIKRPLSFRDIVSMMHLSRSESRALKKTLRTLVREGSLVHTRKGLYGLPDDMKLVTGFFELMTVPIQGFCRRK